MYMKIVRSLILLLLVSCSVTTSEVEVSEQYEKAYFAGGCFRPPDARRTVPADWLATAAPVHASAA